MFDENDDNSLLFQLGKFVIVGIVAFVIDYGVMNGLYKYLHWALVYANTAGFVVSTVCNYYLSKKHVFNMQTSNAFNKFFILSCIGLLINNLVMIACVKGFSIDTFFSKATATAICMVWNFVSKKIVLEK